MATKTYVLQQTKLSDNLNTWKDFIDSVNTVIDNFLVCMDNIQDQIDTINGKIEALDAHISALDTSTNVYIDTDKDTLMVNSTSSSTYTGSFNVYTGNETTVTLTLNNQMGGVYLSTSSSSDWISSTDLYNNSSNGIKYQFKGNTVVYVKTNNANTGKIIATMSTETTPSHNKSVGISIIRKINTVDIPTRTTTVTTVATTTNYNIK